MTENLGEFIEQQQHRNEARGGDTTGGYAKGGSGVFVPAQQDVRFYGVPLMDASLRKCLFKYTHLSGSYEAGKYSHPVCISRRTTGQVPVPGSPQRRRYQHPPPSHTVISMSRLCALGLAVVRFATLELPSLVAFRCMNPIPGSPEPGAVVIPIPRSRPGFNGGPEAVGWPRSKERRGRWDAPCPSETRGVEFISGAVPTGVPADGSENTRAQQQASINFKDRGNRRLPMLISSLHNCRVPEKSRPKRKDKKKHGGGMARAR